MICLYFFLNIVNCVLSLIDTPSLIALDQNLTKLLIKPEPGKGNELLNESEFLCKNLDEVSDLVDDKKPEGIEIYKTIIKAGGVKFINATYKPELLKQVYQFSDDNLAHLRTTLTEIKSIWMCIEVLLNVTQPYSGEDFFEKMAATIRENEKLRGEPEKNYTSSMETSELYS